MSLTMREKKKRGYYDWSRSWPVGERLMREPMEELLGSSQVRHGDNNGPRHYLEPMEGRQWREEEASGPERR